MAKAKRMWIWAPDKRHKPKVPAATKAAVTQRADDLVEKVLKKKYIQPPPKNLRWNYLIDIYTKWHGSFFYFCSVYACPGPDAISPQFESRFARLEYVSPDRFNMAYMRHTEEWCELYRGVSLAEALQAVEDDVYLAPP
jgi:hypothetical protein